MIDSKSIINRADQGGGESRAAVTLRYDTLYEGEFTICV